jgi:uncharacterized protein (TIGR02453 family)
MQYFNPDFLEFFKELAENNNKEWFDSNRKRYEKEVKEPFTKFVEEMIYRVQKIDNDVFIRPMDAIFRINKDIRFSKDKSPYKIQMSANISKFGKKDKSYPCFYFQFSPNDVMVYGGSYMVEKDTLESIRYHIAENHKEFKKVYSGKDFVEKYGTIQGEKNKRIPEDFIDIVKTEPLIANKQFYFGAALNPELVLQPFLPDVLMEYYMAGREVNGFLRQAYGK